MLKDLKINVVVPSTFFPPSTLIHFNQVLLTFFEMLRYDEKCLKSYEYFTNDFKTYINLRKLITFYSINHKFCFYAVIKR